MNRNLLVLLCLIVNFSVIAQVDCSITKMVGEWKHIDYDFYYVENRNMDSLQIALPHSLPDSISHLNNFFGVLNFKADGKYTYQSEKNNYSTKGYFKMLDNSCQMIMSKRVEPRKEIAWRIFFLNDHFLLILHPTPKGDVIDFYYRD